MELRNALAAKFSLTLPPTIIFDHPTSAALARHLLSLLDTSTSALPTATSHALHPADYSSGAIVIAGVGCLYPGSLPADQGLQSFWAAAAQGANLQRPVPLERWDLDHWYSVDAQPGMSYSRFAAFAEGVDGFDAAYFRMSRLEATALDPQVRVVLEAAAEALHPTQQELSTQRDGVELSAALLAATGTYVGCMFTDYMDFLRVTLGAKHSGPVMTGNGAPYQSGRIAYGFGLQGPCIGIDTACSSSLVATHLAHRALETGEAAAAVAAGVNGLLWHETTAGICQLQALSPVGRCQSFDASADGYGRGEGFAAVFLVQADSLTVAPPAIALVLGSAVNQDGRSSSLTAPHGPSQQALLVQALASGGLVAGAVGLVAVHGTGTALGDPIEVGALGGALSSNDHNGPVALASVKSCYGHTEGTAGITGMLLALGMVHYAQLAPVLCLRTVNPYVASALPEYQQGAFLPRQPGASCTTKSIAGTSSFGMSGINAHLLLSRPEGDGVLYAKFELGQHLAWQRQRFWPVSRTSPFAPLLQHVDRRTVQCAARLSAPVLAFCRDHVVQGKKCTIFISHATSFDGSDTSINYLL